MEPARKFTFMSKIWIYEGNNPWHFITVNKRVSSEIKKFQNWPRRGFGSIPVNVTIGNTTWKTSIFPAKTGTYLLPVKKEVRGKENLTLGKSIKIIIYITL